MPARNFSLTTAARPCPIVDASTGEIRDAQIFVGVMGTSNLTYAEATWTQALPDWTGSHVRAFGYLGAVPHCVVPDNLRSGVSKACRYEPDINPTYAEMADHYGTAVIPARVRRPKGQGQGRRGRADRPALYSGRASSIAPSSAWPRPTPPSGSGLIC